MEYESFVLVIPFGGVPEPIKLSFSSNCNDHNFKPFKILTLLKWWITAAYFITLEQQFSQVIQTLFLAKHFKFTHNLEQLVQIFAVISTKRASL